MGEHTILFFLDEFHGGAVNHILHFAGFTVLGYGLGSRNIWFIVASPFVMECGHIYNYLMGVHADLAIKIVPLQLFAWAVFVALGFALHALYIRSKRK